MQISYPFIYYVGIYKFSSYSLSLCKTCPGLHSGLSTCGQENISRVVTVSQCSVETEKLSCHPVSDLSRGWRVNSNSILGFEPKTKDQKG